MVEENLLKDKADIYGGLEPEQAFKKYLDTYADTDEIWAEFIIVYATPYFLGKPIYITQHQTLKQFEEAKNRTPEQAMESYKIQPKWLPYGYDIQSPSLPITLAKTQNHYQSIIPIIDNHTKCRGCAETFPHVQAIFHHLEGKEFCDGLYSRLELAKMKTTAEQTGSRKRTQPESSDEKEHSPTYSGVLKRKNFIDDPNKGEMIKSKQEKNLTGGLKRMQPESSDTEKECSSDYSLRKRTRSIDNPNTGKTNKKASLPKLVAHETNPDKTCQHCGED